VDWSRRVLLGTSAQRAGDDPIACSAWRTPDGGELDLLVVAADLSMAPPGLDDSLCLFRLPRHLLDSWWRLLERAGETVSNRLEGFEAFAVEVARFLAFKEVPVPEGAGFDLLVTRPGQVSFRLEGPAPGVAVEAGGSRLWGGINLGTEAASLVFLNLPARALRDELAARSLPGVPADTLGELVRQFLALFPEYPLVRLRVEPGEGYRLPAGGLYASGCTLDQLDPDVLLLIRHGKAYPECRGEGR
jgi:hypothetical protein